MQLSPPPRDNFNNIEPHDHLEIDNQDFVIRRIPAQWIIEDPKINGKRITSVAFRPSSGNNGGMSIDLPAQITCAGIDPKAHVTTPHWIGSLILNVGDIRHLDLMVGFDPIVPDNPFHGEVWGTFTKSKEKQLKNLSQWFVPIPEVSI